MRTSTFSCCTTAKGEKDGVRIASAAVMAGLSDERPASCDGAIPAPEPTARWSLLSPAPATALSRSRPEPGLRSSGGAVAAIPEGAEAEDDDDDDDDNDDDDDDDDGTAPATIPA